MHKGGLRFKNKEYPLNIYRRYFVLMDMPEKVSIFWFRRDLRLHDNAGVYHALRSGHPVEPVFIFDKWIPELDTLNYPTSHRT
jgi:hypothetical protein